MKMRRAMPEKSRAGRPGDPPMPDMMNVADLSPQQHAFIMLGSETLFLCHMTMFHMEDHCYQLVLRASLPDYAMQRYRALRKRSRQTLFLGNSEQDLMIVPDLQTGARRSFIADVWQGIPQRRVYKEWPWKHQKPVMHNVPVAVERVVYFRHFDFNLEYPRSLTYVLFGSGGEAHMQSYQTREPDFDHVLSLAEVPGWLPARKLEAGVHVNIPSLPARPVRCSNPLMKRTYDVQYEGFEPLHKIEIGRNWWFSTKVVNAKNPCR